MCKEKRKDEVKNVGGGVNRKDKSENSFKGYMPGKKEERGQKRHGKG